MQGTRLYRQSFEERLYTVRHGNGLDDWMLYGEKQPHEAAKERPERLEVVRQNIATQIQLKAKSKCRQNTVARIESRKTAGSLPFKYIM